MSESNITIDPGEGCSLFYSTDYVGVVTATYTGPGGVSGALTKSGNSFIVPNTFSRGVYNVTITAGEVSRVDNINVGVGMVFIINTTKNTSYTDDATCIVPLRAGVRLVGKEGSL